MRRLKGMASVAIGVAGLSVAVVAQKPRAADAPVTTIIRDHDGDVAAELQIQSDGDVYTHSKTLTSKITNTGVWALDSLNPKGAFRTVYLGFTRPIPGTGPNGGDPVAPASGNYRAHLFTSCNHFGNSLWAVAPGETIGCPMGVRFDADGNSYVLQMNVNTEHVNITCLAPGSGTASCSEWLIRPSGSEIAADGAIQLRNLARLSVETSSRGQVTLVPQGDFFFSFSIHLIIP